MTKTSIEKLLNELAAVTDEELAAYDVNEAGLVQLNDKSARVAKIKKLISHYVKLGALFNAQNTFPPEAHTHTFSDVESLAQNVQHYTLGMSGVLVEKVFANAVNYTLGTVVSPYVADIDSDSASHCGQVINLGTSGEWGIALTVGKHIKNGAQVSMRVRFKYASSPSAGQLNWTVRKNGTIVATGALGNTYTVFTTDVVPNYAISNANVDDVFLFSVRGYDALNVIALVEAMQLDINHHLEGHGSPTSVQADFVRQMYVDLDTTPKKGYIAVDVGANTIWNEV